MPDWHGTKGMWVDWMLNPCCDFQLWPHPWQGCQRSGKSQGKFLFFKVREKSGNFVKSQGKSLDMGKSGKSQGILWWMAAILFLSQSYSFMFLSLMLQMEKFLRLLCYVIFWPHKGVLDTVYWLNHVIEVETWYLVFCYTDKYLFALPWSKSATMFLKMY